MAVHQCASFSSNPKLIRERTVKRVGRHLIDTIDHGLVRKVDRMKVMECFIDAEFSGVWNANDPLNSTSVLSKTGFVITYSGLLMHCNSKLQTEIALSSC